MNNFVFSSKVDTPLQEDEDVDVEVLETFEDDEPVGEPVTEMTPTEVFLLRFLRLELLLLLRFLQPKLLQLNLPPLGMLLPRLSQVR